MYMWASQMALVIKSLPANAGDIGDMSSTPVGGRQHPLEESMATYSSIHAWGTPWTEELVGYGL